MAGPMTTSLHPTLAEIDDPHESAGWRATRFDHEETLHTEVLRQLCDLGRPMHLGAAHGRGLAATLHLVDVLQQQLVFRCTADGIAVARALQVRPLWAAAHLHSLRVQFALAAPSATREGAGEAPAGADCFLVRAHWPREIYRAPRRRAERLPRAPHCTPMAHFHQGTQLVSTRAFSVVNISEHGCAVRLPAGMAASVVTLVPGTLLRQVELELDDEHFIVTDARVVHVSATDGGTQELGCRWEEMPGLAQVTLRRWLAQAAQALAPTPAPKKHGEHAADSIG